MWKAGLSEAGSEALMGSLGAEMLAGQPELAVAELALFGFIMAGKKIADHHREKKSRKQDEQNAKNAQAEADRQAQKQAEEEKQRQEDEYQAQLQKQREEEQQAEEARIKAEQERIQAEEEQKQRDLEEQARQREQQAEEQRQHVHDQNQEVIQQDVDHEFRVVNQLELEREERLAIFQGQVDGNAPWRMPIDPNGGNGDPDGGNPEPWRMPNDDPNDPDGADDYVIIDPEGQPARNQYSNPFWEMIGRTTAQIAQQIINQKQNDEEEQKKIIEDIPEVPTEEQKIQIDEQAQTHEDLNQITDNQAIIQQQIIDVLTGLGTEELTLEQSLAELDKIQQDLDKIIGSQVKTTQIYSSGIKTF